MVTVNLNDTFQWKNSSHKVVSFGLGGKVNNTSDDTLRNTEATTKLFDADQLAKLGDMVCKYYDHFATEITITNRARVRELADCFWTYAKEELYDELSSKTAAIIDDERRRLEEELCGRVTTLNSIAGTTRGCFAQTIIGKTLSENALAMARLQSEADLNARTLEASTIAAAFDRVYSAYILGDEADFNKYSGLLQILRGACAAEDVIDSIDRDIREVGITGQFEHTAGDISDVEGTYANEYADILAAGQAVLGTIGA